MSKKTVSGTFTQYAVKQAETAIKEKSNGSWLYYSVVTGYAWYAAEQGHIALPHIQSLGPQKLQEYISQLNYRNRECGFPVVIQGDMQNMVIADWLNIDFHLRKHEALSRPSTTEIKLDALPSSNSSFLTGLVIEQQSLFMQFALDKLGVVVSLLVGVATLIPAILLGGAGAAAVAGVLTIIWALMNCYLYHDVIQSGKLQDSLVQEVSSTWKDVFEVKNYADVTLISLMAQAAREWPEDMPAVNFMEHKPSEVYAFLLSVASTYSGEIVTSKLFSELHRCMGSCAAPPINYLNDNNTSSFQPQQIDNPAATAEPNSVVERTPAASVDL